jgi:hypothetical protein
VALLAYLLLADRPPGRRHLAELLFGDADDPLGALRWTLAELRRTLGAPELFAGDPVATTLGPGITVDLHAMASGRAGAAVPYAARVVAGNSLEEGNHELLVRCLAAAGDRDAALRHAVTPPCRASPWPPSAAPWSTPCAAGTRRVRWSCTRRSGWPPRPATGPPR